jgi:hypothetical protein
MKSTSMFVFVLAVVVNCSPAFAQHGHAGGGMNGGMGDSVTHGSMNASEHSNSTANASSHQAMINDILSKNPAIGDKIATLTGDKLGAADACTGFKNLGQCVAAAHVSKNHPGLNFYCLRQAMTGIPAGSSATSGGCTVTGPMSLGKSIQKLDPQADSKTESRKAETEAQQDLKRSGVKS